MIVINGGKAAAAAYAYLWRISGTLKAAWRHVISAGGSIGSNGAAKAS